MDEVCVCSEPELWFDRTICHCGAMHYFCHECGFQKEECWGTKVTEVTEVTVADAVRTSVLKEATELTNGDRNNQYGPPTQDFQRTADVLGALGYSGPGGRKLVSHDTAVMVAAVKLSRISWSPEKRDHWVDLAGYAACGFECVEEEGKGE